MTENYTELSSGKIYCNDYMKVVPDSEIEANSSFAFQQELNCFQEYIEPGAIKR